MLTRRNILDGGLAGLAGPMALRPLSPRPARAAAMAGLSDAEWRRRLSPMQYDVLRQEGTERPFTSPLLHEERSGTFACAGCGLPLFSSKTKFDSHTGWPSFWAPLDGAVSTASDGSLGMDRTAVACVQCSGHLGHVFDDGPRPTGLRYCMNGVAMAFSPGSS